jgi:hypothetical protein
MAKVTIYPQLHHKGPMFRVSVYPEADNVALTEELTTAFKVEANEVAK